MTKHFDFLLLWWSEPILFHRGIQSGKGRNHLYSRFYWIASSSRRLCHGDDVLMPARRSDVMASFHRFGPPLKLVLQANSGTVGLIKSLRVDGVV